MQIEEYENVYRQEDVHWWYRSLHELVLIFLKKFFRSDDSAIVLLDTGCGTGGALRSLQKNCPSWRLVGTDLSSQALSYCRKSKGVLLIQASVDNLPFNAESVDVLICLDVLYHLDVASDQLALNQMQRVLKKGGYILIQVPAFECLRRSHDRVVYTRERYTRSKLYSRMKQSGFEIIRCSYRHMILFPLILTEKITGFHRFNKAAKSDLQPLPCWLNNTLKFISDYENRLLQYFNLPFGSSIFCLAKKE